MAHTTDSPTPLACNLKAISPANRPRYNDLVKRLRQAASQKMETAGGYTFTVDQTVIGLSEIAEWITMEKLCCPFLTFQINVESKGDPKLTLAGPKGVKAVLDEEFSAKP